MRTRMIFAVLATMFVTSTALADELPPFSGSHDDASYGDMTHSTFTTEGLPGGSALAAGSAHDDTAYPSSDAPANAQKPALVQMACSCAR